MLVQLHIENFALIDRLVVEFGPGLNVLTGETGAGKSMIVGALGLILGQRANTEMVQTDDKPIIVEALFDTSRHPHLAPLLDSLGIDRQDTTLLLKRTVTKSGSRCYINASLATLSMLHDLAQHLVDILGQHQYQTLLRREQQLTLLDAYGGVSEDVIALRHAYQRHQELMQDLQHLQQNEQQHLQRQDLVRFQVNEIDKAQLQLHEEDQLIEEQHLLLNAEKLYELSQEAYGLLYQNDHAVLEMLAATLEKLSQLADLDTRQGTPHKEVQEAYYVLESAAQQVRDYGSRIEIDPDRLQAVEDRLVEIARLKRKYGPTIAAILAYRDQLRHEQQDWERRDDRLEAGTAELTRLRQSLKSLAVTLSDKRRQTAERLQQAVQQELQDLNMSGTVFQIACRLRYDAQGDVTVGNERVTLTADGIDEVEYLFAPNPGQPLKPLARIASGGELSRVMLAVKSILAREDRIPTLILDEVDAGIGGQTAKLVGEKLRRIARTHQLFCITHLPQIASHGDHHYRVEKIAHPTHSSIQIQRLDFTARIEEIARMSGGKQITTAARKHAEEMLTKQP